MTTFGDSSTTNNLKLPKLVIRTLLHVSSQTWKHMHNCPVFTLKLLIYISLSMNIATKFMECMASNWGYRLYYCNTFVLSPCFWQSPHANPKNFQNWKMKNLQNSCMYRILKFHVPWLWHRNLDWQEHNSEEFGHWHQEIQAQYRSIPDLLQYLLKRWKT